MNKGWFNSAASRAMLVHTRWFDSKLPSDEAVIGKEGITILKNELGRYAKTRKVRVKVLNQDGTAAVGVKVRFSIINYAEAFPIAEVITDEQGKAAFLTGNGSVYIEALSNYDSDQCEYAYALCEQTAASEMVLDLKALAEGAWQKFDMVAPKDSAEYMVKTDRSQEEAKQKSIIEANNKRKELHEKDCNHDLESFRKTIQFQEWNRSGAVEKLEKVLSEKDLTDITLDVLTDAFYQVDTVNAYAEGICLKYLINPRVDKEILRPYKKQICAFFSEEEKSVFIEDSRKLMQYIDQNIVSEDTEEYTSIFSSPMATLRSGYGSVLSKKILFVAACRAFGIAARLNPVTGEPEYRKEEIWIPAQTDKEFDSKICLHHEDTAENFEWKYQENWSLAILTKDGFKTLHLENIKWKKDALELFLQHGIYRILTAQRMPDGNQFCSQFFFVIQKGEEKDITLCSRKYNLSDLLEQNTLPEIFLEDLNGTERSSKALWRENEQISIWLEEGNEPTEHILNEIMQKESAYKKIADRMNFIIKSRKAIEDPVISKVLKKIENIHVMLDCEDANLELVGRKMYVDFGKLPLILVTDAEGNGIYASSGYNVGIGELLLNILGRNTKASEKKMTDI